MHQQQKIDRLPLLSRCRPVAGLVILSCSLAWSGIRALESDWEQVLDYSSDGGQTIELIDGVRVITMEDNVSVSQGTLAINGERAVLEIDPASDELRKVTVTGGPARFQQQPAPDSSLIRGNSETIIYEVNEEPIVEFIGSANFSQEGSTFRCVRIRHALNSSSTQTTGPCAGTLAPQADPEN